MTDERWLDLMEQLTSDKKIIERQTESLEPHPGTVERVVIDSAMGRLCLSRTTQPKRITEHALYSKRGGSTAAIQTEYDENEIIHVFTVERFDEATDEWVEIDVKHFSLP